MKRLRFSRRAKLDLLNIVGWIASDRPLAARHVVGRLIERTEASRETPEMGPHYSVYGAGVRGFPSGLKSFSTVSRTKTSSLSASSMAPAFPRISAERLSPRRGAAATTC
ncbi:type II toxin-antitoxin system RelE/ParE family toxin [Caulobacter sp. FWC2]|uniref:type II toxin-antitoxin system RelE/ParE family toxin n=1 Tax=Caulobacter sp. FWC2 TaxID=69664 RepID=UPI001177BE91